MHAVADTLKIDRSDFSRRLGRDDISSKLVLDICKATGHNFFEDYAKEVAIELGQPLKVSEPGEKYVTLAEVERLLKRKGIP